MNSILIYLILSITASCFSNHPYPKSERGENIYYDRFTGEPKHLDPARAYSSDEYRILAQIYEPLFQYHYLKRPYVLIPETSRGMPRVQKHRAGMKYTIRIKRGIKYQLHPAFAKDNQGDYIYIAPENIKDNVNKNARSFAGEIANEQNPLTFKHLATRELTASDYVYQIKRMANPLVRCPIYPVLASYIVGFAEFAKKINGEIEAERARRKKDGGLFYNRTLDERHNPIFIDLRKIEMGGLKVTSKYSFELQLKKKYPQMIYWMSMPFFSPMPWEADRFYLQKIMVENNITLDRFPVGTGPYVLAENNPNYRMVLVKNKNFHAEFYPRRGEKGDRKLGLLRDAGKRLPFIEKAVYVLEKESIPAWLKFLQGYYDTSAIDNDVFETAVTMSANGAELTPEMKKKKIRLMTAKSASTYYYAFNMLDGTVGATRPKNKFLRQAIAIAFDIEEYIEIFQNSRGVAADGPIPPGIFGHALRNYNKTIYRYNYRRKKRVRRSLSEAKKLLAKAGYANGLKNGKPLILFYDTVQQGAGASAQIEWMRKQFAKLNIELQIRASDYVQFRSKVNQGNFQILSWGWNADYPDPENFLFLLYGANSKAKFQGENAANFNNAKFNRLFRQMENMKSSYARLRIIDQMIKVFQDQMPWFGAYHPIGFGLFHDWYQNAKPMLLGNNTLKYKKVDAKKREIMREQWNQAITWPLYLTLGFVLITILFSFALYLYKDRKA